MREIKSFTQHRHIYFQLVGTLFLWVSHKGWHTVQKASFTGTPPRGCRCFHHALRPCRAHAKKAQIVEKALVGLRRAAAMGPPNRVGRVTSNTELPGFQDGRHTPRALSHIFLSMILSQNESVNKQCISFNYRFRVPDGTWGVALLCSWINVEACALFTRIYNLSQKQMCLRRTYNAVHSREGGEMQELLQLAD